MRNLKPRLKRLERRWGKGRAPGLAVIFGQPGETEAEAKQSHYAEHPGAKKAPVKLIFENSDPAVREQSPGVAPKVGDKPAGRPQARVLDKTLPYQVLRGCYMQGGRRFWKDTLEEMPYGPPSVPSELSSRMSYDRIEWRGRVYLIQNGWLFHPQSLRRIDPLACPPKADP
jgi:hypothetical protein